MRPPPRTTRKSGSPPSPTASERPRPTLADIEIAPRRRLRDGSSSSRSRGRSRGSSVASTSSRGSESRKELSRRAAQNNAMPRAARIERDAPSASSSGSAYGDSDGGGTYQPSLASGSGSASRESSLSPLPDTGAPSRRRSLVREEHSLPQSHVGLSILDRLEYSNMIGETSPVIQSSLRPPQEQAPAIDSTASGSNTSASSIELEPEAEHGIDSDVSVGKRYTRHQKGKGRAVITPIDIGSSPEAAFDNDESIRIVKVARKRRRSSSEAVESQLPIQEGEGGQGGVAEEDSLAGGYSCPICFCPPAQAVVTPCGHMLCASCLHSALTAAIGRNPTPWPTLQTQAQRGRAARGRGGRNVRGGRNHASAPHAADVGSLLDIIGNGLTSAVEFHGPGPKHWTTPLLQEYWHRHLGRECEKQLLSSGISKDNWAAIAELNIPKKEEIKVENPLNGLWKVDSSWVVEGDCPVCRNHLPGGYGPPGTGIGGIIPVLAKVARPPVRLSKRNKPA
ncbi:hypothetical protein IAU60_001169 [Kwoniella sp. DSM 27419]